MRNVGRPLRWVLGEILAILSSVSGMYLWCAFVLGYLKFDYYELFFPLTVPCCMVAIILMLEDLLAELVKKTRRRRPISAMVTGFTVAAAFALFILKIMGENYLSQENIADILLAGLVLGMPSGLIAEYIRNDAKNYVDTKDSVL